jgi:hypothetical protein
MNEIGTNPYRPIPFDTLAKEVFDNFLYLIYYGAEHLEYLSPGEWFKIKRLCTDWCFPRLTATIVRQLVIFRRRSLPPPLRMMASNLPVYRVFDKQERLSKRIRGRTILVEESSDEEETIVEDNPSRGVMLQLFALLYFYFYFYPFTYVMPLIPGHELPYL